MAKILISGSEGKMESYARAVLRAGGEPLCQYAPMEPEHGCDGLILCGGGDLSPKLFGGVSVDTDRDIDLRREQSDSIQISAFLASGKPILGICRGMQMLNVMLGGSLIQDLEERCVHHWRTEHEVAIKSGMHRKLYGPRLMVNSIHHQAVKAPAPGFLAVAISEDGVIEAIEHMSLPIIGVQWHPERMERGAVLFRHFIATAKKRSRD